MVSDIGFLDFWVCQVSIDWYPCGGLDLANRLGEGGRMGRLEFRLSVFGHFLFLRWWGLCVCLGTLGFRL